MNTEGGGDNRVKILMLPWLAHGHISPFLELAKRLAERNCVVYICSTTANLSIITSRITQTHASSIHLLELTLPPIPHLPPNLHTTNALPPSLSPSLLQAFNMAAPSFYEIFNSIHPHLLIYDIFHLCLPEVVAAGIPFCVFITCSAAAGSFFFHARRWPELPFPFPYIFLHHYELTESEYIICGSGLRGAVVDESHVVLIRSSECIEKEEIGYFGTLIDKKMVSLGSLFDKNPIVNAQVEDGKMREWLAGKEEASVLYMSFGTEHFPSEEDLKEMAWGLEMSGVSFIWVLRFPAGSEKALPEGFLEKVEGRGKVVEWTSQREILQHTSIGAMVTHCGWGSLMEAMASGVPVVGLPMRGDQPLNCRLVVEMGVGVEAGRDEDGRLDKGRLAEVIRAIVFGEMGRKMKKKTREIQQLLRRDEEFENALRQISDIIGKNI